mmetsp:Transcript_438/g.395  ORF Transcript_438/g.395 Transcript_438/m.395 type:complete len:163 (+) Transcript_438:88-576(+)
MEVTKDSFLRETEPESNSEQLTIKEVATVLGIKNGIKESMINNNTLSSVLEAACNQLKNQSEDIKPKKTGKKKLRKKAKQHNYTVEKEDKYNWDGEKIEAEEEREESIEDCYSFGNQKSQAQTPFEVLQMRGGAKPNIDFGRKPTDNVQEIDELEKKLDELL